MTLRKKWLKIVRNLLGLKKSEEKEIKYHEVIKKETELLQKRRAKLHLESPDDVDNNKFGIALSGGGIRSATINLGFLQTLNEFNLLQRADYISTVSGGGYTGAYIQATLKSENGDYDKLFQDEHIDHMRAHGEYLIPGNGFTKMLNRVILIVGFLISLLMSWLSPFIIGMMGYLAFLLLNHFGLNQGSYEYAMDFLFSWIVPMGVILIFFHFILNVLLNYNLRLSNLFNKIETLALVAFGLVLGGIFIWNLNWSGWGNLLGGEARYYLLVMFALFVLGYFSNPNALSFHRFYRNQLANAFLANAKNNGNILLQNLIEDQTHQRKEDGFIYAPYPLINTCLNLQSSVDQKIQKFGTAKQDFLADGKMQQAVSFAGAKTNDYFLLSPLFCGSKLTGYVPTFDTYNYRDLTLPAAATISAAAVNPGMGTYSSKFLSILTTVFNARLGYWILNPKKTKLYDSLVWWPRYFVYELLSKIGIDNEMLNISDGGHIENLGIYELLRRRCKLIIAVDAGADPKFTFNEFQNLAIRARNELGLEIRFPKNYLEDKIRPKPSIGYSEKRFAIAEICHLWEEILLRDYENNIIKGSNGKPIEVLINYKIYDSNPDRVEAVEDILAAVKKQITGQLNNKNLITQALKNIETLVTQRLENDLKIGTLVYVKSSIIAPEGKPKIDKERDPLRYYTYKYKIYHPDFPHESTADQFFDPVQWTAYYELGRYICGDVLGIDNLDKYLQEMEKSNRPDVNIDELVYRRFGRRVKIFEEHKQEWEEAQRAKKSPKQTPLSRMRKAAPAPPPTTMRELEKRMEDAAPSEIREDEATISSVAPSAPADSSKIVVGEECDYKM